MTSTLAHRSAAAVLGALLLLGTVGCSSDGSDAGGTTAPSGAAAEGGSDAGSTDAGSSDPVGDLGDPCQWFTAEEMGAVLGFDVTMAAEETPIGDQCVYDSQERFTAVTVRPQTAADHDAYRSAREGMDSTVIDHPGVGDTAWIDNDGTRGNSSVALQAKKGTTAITVELATSGDAVPSVDAGTAIVDQVAKKALGE